jgi:hypothetical protein
VGGELHRSPDRGSSLHVPGGAIAFFVVLSFVFLTKARRKG